MQKIHDCIPKTCDSYAISVIYSCVYIDYSASQPTVLYDVWRELKQATGNKTIIAISPGHNATPGSGSSTLPGINYNRTTYSAHIVPAGFLI
jgi:hypothetical protein